MNKALRWFLFTATFLLLTLAVLASCNSTAPSTETLSVGTVPETTARVVPEGTLYVRCSEPEDNCFSIQFIAAVPTRAVDYVGFEARRAYADGTRGAIDAGKQNKLYKELIDEDAGLRITATDFGMEDGYLFGQSMDSVPIDEPDLAYEISSYYVIGDEKYYTARQVFSVSDLLKEHILKDPQPLRVEEITPVVDVQKWLKCTQTIDPVYSPDVESESIYYIGASAPDENGNLDLYLCYALSSNLYNTVGLRYRFTATEGTNAGVSTSLRRVRDDVVYEKVITETETLTIEDFGMEEGYLVVLQLSDSVNTVRRSGYILDLVAYYSRNAIETKVIQKKLDFNQLVKDTVVVSTAVSVGTYDFIPQNYSDWVVFSEEAGNAVGEGTFLVRVSELSNLDTVPRFDAQITAATPTRFASKIAMIYTIYDADGNPINGKVDQESKILSLFQSIFGNTLEDADRLTAAHLGVERGYLMSLRMRYIKLEEEADLTIHLRAVLVQNGETTTLVSLRIPVANLIELIPGYEA